MAGKGVRAGGTMNVCIAVLLCFALLGALDEGSGGRLGVLLFCWMTWGLFVPERSVMPPDVVFSGSWQAGTGKVQPVAGVGRIQAGRQ